MIGALIGMVDDFCDLVTKLWWVKLVAMYLRAKVLVKIQMRHRRQQIRAWRAQALVHGGQPLVVSKRGKVRPE